MNAPIKLIAALSLSLQAQTNAPKHETELRTPPPTMSNVAYGQRESQALDFRKADANKPTPVMVYFHGGGFTKRSKRQISRDIHVNAYLKNGISCISADCPFSKDEDE